MATLGYMRVCREDPLLDRRRDALAAAGVPAPHRVAEHGKHTHLRPALDALLDRLVPGDTLVVWTLGRLGADAAEVARVVQDLDRRGLRLVVTGLGLDTAAPAGRLVPAVMAQLAPPDEEAKRQDGGARAHGVGRAGRRSRPQRSTPEQAAQARRMVREQKRSYAQVAAAFGVSRSVAWRAIDDIPPPRPAALRSPAASTRSTRPHATEAPLHPSLTRWPPRSRGVRSSRPRRPVPRWVGRP